MRNVLMVGTVVILAVLTWHVSQAEPEVAQFRITIATSAQGAQLECLRGCAWKTLTFDCKQNLPCKMEVDQHGVKGLAK